MTYSTSYDTCIVIHIGGNDIGVTRLGYLVYKLKKFISWLSQQMPRNN